MGWATGAGKGQEADKLQHPWVGGGGELLCCGMGETSPKPPSHCCVGASHAGDHASTGYLGAEAPLNLVGLLQVFPDPVLSSPGNSERIFFKPF